MRTAYLVTYDVTDPDRLRKVYKVMRRYGDHLQLSVFRCVLGDIELVRMRQDLLDVIHAREDQVLVVNLGPEEGRAEGSITALGRAYTHPERHALVV